MTFLSFLVFVAFFFGLPILAVWGWVCCFRSPGRSRPVSSGLAGILTEVDRVIRPSVVHQVEAKEKIEVTRNDPGGN